MVKISEFYPKNILVTQQEQVKLSNFRSDMGKVGLVLSKMNKEFKHTHATSNIPEGTNN